MRASGFGGAYCAGEAIKPLLPITVFSGGVKQARWEAPDDNYVGGKTRNDNGI